MSSSEEEEHHVYHFRKRARPMADKVNRKLLSAPRPGTNILDNPYLSLYPTPDKYWNPYLSPEHPYWKDPAVREAEAKRKAKERAQDVYRNGGRDLLAKIYRRQMFFKSMARQSTGTPQPPPVIFNF